MDEITKIGVVGLGHLGQHHTKHFSRLGSANLVGVYDINKRKRVETALKFKTKPFESLETLLEKVDAISIVTPTQNHSETAKICIEKEKHVFIEKPISETVEEANELIALAEEKNVIIQVGHVERLNSALLPLENFDINPKFIEVQRLAPYMIRGTEVPVVLDLMIHDIDLVLAIVKSPVKQIHASGVSIMTDSVDIANARMRFENGTVASITSSRVAKDQVRKMKVFQQDLYITIDFLIGLTEVYKVMDASKTDPV